MGIQAPEHKHRWPLRGIWHGLMMAILVSHLSTGCATAPPKRATSVVKLDPLRFKAVDHKGEKVVEVLDPKILFKEAGMAFKSKDYDAAIRKYGLVLLHFPESKLANLSRYNVGVALQRAKRHQEAVPFLQAVVDARHGTKDAHDALFQLASCQEVLEDWNAVAEALTQVIAPEFAGILPMDRIEALARRGQAKHKLGNLARAERDYQSAIKVYKKHLDNHILVTSRYVSLVHFQVGEIYREIFRTIRFKLPLDRMARDLEEKSNYFLKAHNAFLRTVRLHHSEFAVHAGYQLGALYEGFYDDMLAAEVPADLDDEEVELYFGELKKTVKPLIERAIDIFERNLKLGDRVGNRSEWVRRTEASLARLKAVLQEDATRDAMARVK